MRVPTRSEDHERARQDGRRDRLRAGSDPAEEIALVACMKRELLLRVHRHRLRHADLEDCYSQAVLELITSARHGVEFSGRAHIANAIEQRFVSRIHDRRRALAGRSPMQAALESSVRLGELAEEQALVDGRVEVEPLVMLRYELMRLATLANELTPDQRLVLACQVGLQMERREFCRRYRWSGEKYRKVAQRARARLRELTVREELPVPGSAPRRKGS